MGVLCKIIPTVNKLRETFIEFFEEIKDLLTNYNDTIKQQLQDASDDDFVGLVFQLFVTFGTKLITVSTSVSKNVVTVKTTNNLDQTSTTDTVTIPNKGSLTTTLTPTGNNTTTKTFEAGYYEGGTITANGATAYAAGQSAVNSITKTFTFTRTSEYELTCSTGYTGYSGAKLNSFGSNVSFYIKKQSGTNPGTQTLMYVVSYNSSTGVVTIGAGTISDCHYKFNGSSNCSITLFK